MTTESKELNKDNSDVIKLLADVTKQNSDSIAKQTENITKLVDGQDSITKTLETFGDNITKSLTEALKQNVHASDNNNPVESGLGMEQKPKVENAKDVGDKTTAPNAYAPGEYGSTGRGGNEPGGDKGVPKMENKDMKEGYPEGEKKTDEKPKEEKKAEGEEKPKEEKKTEDKPKEETKEDPEKENKYKSFNYDNNTTIRPQAMSKSFESYPDGYQIIKAALNGWGVEGIDGDGAYTETIKRLNNYEFGSFGQEGGQYQ